jgi:hypothetical protein
MTAAHLREITRSFLEEVDAQGGRIRSVYYCTHRVEDDCQCRKPKPGLLLKAQAEHHFPFQETFLIGDSESDLLAAHAVGCPTIMISNAAPANLEKLPHRPQAIVPSLLAAAAFLVHLEKMLALMRVTCDRLGVPVGSPALVMLSRGKDLGIQRLFRVSPPRRDNRRCEIRKRDQAPRRLLRRATRLLKKRTSMSS